MSSQYFLLSGGSGGIGAALALKLTNSKLKPLIGYAQNRDRAEEIALECGGTAVHLDLRQTDTILSAVEYISANFSNLSGVLLAGSPPPVLARFSKIKPEDLEHQIQVNVIGSQLLLAQLSSRIFQKSRAGLVIGVLSHAMGSDLKASSSSMGAYIIAKYGLRGVLAAAAADYSWLTVRETLPSFTKTNMLNAFDPRFIEKMELDQMVQTSEQAASELFDIISNYLTTQAEV